MGFSPLLCPSLIFVVWLRLFVFAWSLQSRQFPHLHSDWVTKVLYIPELSFFLSSSLDSRICILHERALENPCAVTRNGDNAFSSIVSRDSSREGDEGELSSDGVVAGQGAGISGGTGSNNNNSYKVRSKKMFERHHKRESIPLPGPITTSALRLVGSSDRCMQLTALLFPLIILSLLSASSLMHSLLSVLALFDHFVCFPSPSSVCSPSTFVQSCVEPFHLRDDGNSGRAHSPPCLGCHRQRRKEPTHFAFPR